MKSLSNLPANSTTALLQLGKMSAGNYQLWWLAARFLGIDLLYDKVGWQK